MLFEIIFEIDNGIWYNTYKCVVIANNEEEARKHFDNWIFDKLDYDSSVSEVIIKKCTINRDNIVYTDYQKGE